MSKWRMHNLRIKRKPLPGVRQGTSGADAGCNSMRAVSAGVLEEPAAPAGIPEQVTGTVGSHHLSPEVVNYHIGMSRLLKVQDPNKTSVVVGARYRWKHTDNCDILRAYNIATQCGRDKTGYSIKLPIEFKKLRVDLERFSNQNILDRYRYIVSKPVITIVEQNHIRDEVYRAYFGERETGLDHTVIPGDIARDIEIERVVPVRDIEIHSQMGAAALIDEMDEIDVKMKIQLEDQFETYKTMYEGTDPNLRPSIPRIQPNRQVHQMLYVMNLILANKMTGTIEDVQLHAYCAAMTVVKMMGGCVEGRNTVSKYTKQNMPRWKIRIEKKIDRFRSTLSKLNVWRQQQYSTKSSLKQQVFHILNNQKIWRDDSNYHDKIDLYMNTLKQKIAVLGKRLRRYNKSHKKKAQNRKFNQNQKQFYNSFGKKYTGETPTVDVVEDFWSNIWLSPGTCNTEAPWIREMQTRDVFMEDPVVTSEDLALVIGKLKNWRTAGPDSVHNFWWKYLVALHPSMLHVLNEIINGQTELPHFLTQAITYLKPKNEQTDKPENYRPITCLNTIYKILTSVIAHKVGEYVSTNNIISEEQKGCTKNSKGCKEQLLIDAVVTGQVKKQNRNLAVAWIDYQKAYDSIPHEWLLKVLEIYNIHPKLVTLMKILMSNWRTQLVINDNSQPTKTGSIAIRRGIFQGDAFSPLWFCLAVNPLSTMLKNTGMGFKLKEQNETIYKISHLFYMDDLKLYASSENELVGLLKTTAQFTDDIQMNFGIPKCATLLIKHGKMAENQDIDFLVGGRQLPCLDAEHVYKYLGFTQLLTKRTKIIKRELEDSFRYRLKKILSSELNAKNKVMAINTWSVAVLAYSFGVVEWSQTDLERLNILMRTTLTKYRIHHPRSAIERLYLSRKQGGRGFLDIKTLCNRQIVSLKKFFQKKSNTSPLHKAIVMGDKAYTPLNLANREWFPHLQSTTDRMKAWRSKALHGRFPHSLEKADLNASVRWLRDGFLFAETEGFIHAIQDQVIATNNYKKVIEKLDVEDRCRMCHGASETIDHLIAGCPNLANTEYLKRHNLTAGILHQEIAHMCGLISVSDNTPYYIYQPKQILENQAYRLYFDLPIHTDKTIVANRPDIVLHDHIVKKAWFIDVTHPGDHNIDKAEADKIAKYVPLANEYKEIYNLQSVEIVPVVITATGLINRNLKKYITKLKLKSEVIISKMQKSVILNTCRIVRTVLNIDSNSLE